MPHLVTETRTRTIGEIAIATIADFKNSRRDLKDFPDRTAVGKRTIILRPVAHALPTSDVRTGILMAHIEANIGVCFVVFKTDVVLGLVLLDERVFEKQRFDLGPCSHEFHIDDVGDEMLGFSASLIQVLEITADAVFEALGLAHVDDQPVGIFHEVDAG